MTTISTNSFYDSALTDMSALQAQANKLQAQIATGSKLQQSSDNPVMAAQMRVFSRQDATSAIDIANANTAEANLNLASNGLTGMINITQQIQVLATQAASATLNDSQRASIGAQIDSMQQNLVALANTKNSVGNSLFGGETAGPAYTVDAAGHATYAGTANAAQVSLGNGLSVTGGITGPEFLKYTSGGTATDLLAVIKTLGDALQQAGTGGQAAAHGALSQLSDGLAALSTGQTLVGSRLAWITSTNSLRTQIDQQRAADESHVGSTDITAAVTRLQQTMTALQASQASFVKLSSLSLFSLLH
jgi:flagellar hook-associated protein 3 FlgL